MYEMLQNGEWQIGDCCTALIETLPMLTREEKKPEDGIKFEGDDALDATRYLLYSKKRAGQPSQADRIELRVQELKEDGRLTDPTSEMIWRNHFAKLEECKSQPIRFARREISRRRKAAY